MAWIRKPVAKLVFPRRLARSNRGCDACLCTQRHRRGRAGVSYSDWADARRGKFPSATDRESAPVVGVGGESSQREASIPPPTHGAAVGWAKNPVARLRP